MLKVKADHPVDTGVQGVRIGLVQFIRRSEPRDDCLCPEAVVARPIPGGDVMVASPSATGVPSLSTRCSFWAKGAARRPGRRLLLRAPPAQSRSACERLRTARGSGSCKHSAASGNAAALPRRAAREGRADVRSSAPPGRCSGLGARDESPAARPQPQRFSARSELMRRLRRRQSSSASESLLLDAEGAEAFHDTCACSPVGQHGR